MSFSLENPILGRFRAFLFSRFAGRFTIVKRSAWYVEGRSSRATIYPPSHLRWERKSATSACPKCGAATKRNGNEPSGRMQQHIHMPPHTPAWFITVATEERCRIRIATGPDGSCACSSAEAEILHAWMRRCGQQPMKRQLKQGLFSHCRYLNINSNDNQRLSKQRQ